VKERIGVTHNELVEINRLYAPFSHATTKENARIIDECGLMPRKETGSGGVYCDWFQSMDDRIYFASARYGGYHSINALTHAFGDDMKKVYRDGVVYLLAEITPELAPFLAIDEDCLEEAERNNEQTRSDYEGREEELPSVHMWNCDNALTSLDLIHAVAIAHVVPRDMLVKMSVKRFCERFYASC